MLAIVAKSTSKTSETFIRNDVMTLAPGATILVCQDSTGADGFGCPVLSGIDLEQSPGLKGGWGGLWRRHVDPGLTREDRRRVLAFFDTYQPKAVLAEYGPLGCRIGRACEEAGVPLYVRFRGYDASRLLRKRRRVRHFQRLFERAAGIVPVSRFLADNLARIGCPSDKLHVQSSGIDPRRFVPAAGHSQRVLALGRLVEKKAPHRTIEAFARVAAMFPKARLDIVGDGPLAARCQALISDAGLSGRVHMHGAQGPECVARMMQEASLFVQHSVTARNGDCEGLPGTILEAMASGLPVVSTRHSGIPEAVVEGATGLLTDEHDVEGMAAAIAALLDDPGRGAAMGAAGRQRVLEHFTLDHVRDRLRAIMGFAPAAEP